MAETVPLRMLEISELQRETCNRRSPLWYGRVVVLLAFQVQTISTSILFIRRLQVQGGRYLIDNRNGLVALCGNVAGVLCLAIQLLDFTWRVQQSSAAQVFSRYHAKRCRSQMGVNYGELILVAWIHCYLSYDILRPWDFLLVFLHWTVLDVWNVLVVLICPLLAVLIGLVAYGDRAICLFMAWTMCAFSIAISVLFCFTSITPNYGSWKDPLADVLWAF